MTHLGKGTSHQTTTTVSVAGNTAVNAGTATYVATNGDKLLTNVAGRVTFTATGSEATFVDTITGGTGRFDGRERDVHTHGRDRARLGRRVDHHADRHRDSTRTDQLLTNIAAASSRTKAFGSRTIFS